MTGQLSDRCTRNRCLRILANVSFQKLVAAMFWLIVLSTPNAFAHDLVIQSPSSGRQASLALDAIFEQKIITTNIPGVLRRANALPVEDRFDFLSAYVLPNTDHSGFRVSGEFFAAEANASLGENGELELNKTVLLKSPVFVLLDAAKQVEKLSQLRDAVVDQVATDTQTENCKLSLLMLIDLELKNHKLASQSALALLKNVEEDKHPSVHKLWPATLVAFRGVHQFGSNADVLAIVELLNSRPLNKVHRESYLWLTQVGRIYAESLLQASTTQNRVVWSEPKDWVRGERPHLWMDAAASKPVWAINEKREVHHLSGYRDDACFYRYPLSGDFEVVGDIQSNGRTQFLISGQGMGLMNGGRQRKGNFRKGFTGVAVKELPNESGAWTRFRMQFKGENVRLWLNGKRFQEARLPIDRAPWFAFSGWWSQRMQFRNVQISSNAKILNSIPLSTVGSADSWTNYDGSSWAFDRASGEIRGAKQGGPGLLRGSLFRYMRPLQGGESVEYEFYYEPGASSAAHPSLGRLAFLLRPNEIRTHYMTSRWLEQSAIAPQNEITEQRYQQDDAEYTLKTGMWNHVKLDFVDGVATISLNGNMVFRRPLTASSLPFGVFRHTGDQPSRVRNVFLSGNWPGSIGEVQQELTNPIVKDLNKSLADYPAVFTHDFVANGIPREVGQFDSGGGRTQATPKGVAVYRPGVVDTWTGSRLMLPFSVQGDFDIEVAFSDLDVKSDHYAAILLDVHLADKQLSWARLLRHLYKNKQNSIQTSVSKMQEDGKRTFGILSENRCDSLSGRLRIARKDKTLHFLFAEGNSDLFQLYDSQVLSGAPTVPSEIILEVLTEGNGSSAVTWKNVRVSADGLAYHGDAGERPPGVLYVMNADGTGLKKLSTMVGDAESQGSPEWSPDGKQIAFDEFTGRSDTQMFLINADGSGQRVLGHGAMPSFSADGKRVASTTVDRGLVTMDLLGGSEQVVSADGWGIQWSPDGNWMAFDQRQRQPNGSVQRNIVVVNTKSKQRRTLLNGSDARRYTQIYWNMEWSPDSQQICFKGRVLGSRHHVAIANLDGSPVRILIDAETDTDFGWHPDGSRILFAGLLRPFGYGSMAEEQGLRGHRIFEFELATNRISLLKSQPMELENRGMVWSPDGSKIAFIGRAFANTPQWTGERSFPKASSLSPIVLE